MRLAPKGWASFQHYKDRNPPWIRLHKTLLDNYEFQQLPVASRALAPMLWLLASDSKDGVFDGSITKLAFRLRQTEKEITAALKPLIDNGFFFQVQNASKVLAQCRQVDAPETETETETETEEPTVLVPKGDGAPLPVWKLPDCPYQAIIDLYHDALPTLPRLDVLSDYRRGLMRQRWREVCTDQKLDRDAGLEWFRDYFAIVRQSDFLLGKGSVRPGERAFLADLEWLVRPQNFVKVYEGKYQRRAA